MESITEAFHLSVVILYRYYAVNYATIQFAPMLATAVCPDLLVGKLYDREAQRQHPGQSQHNLPCTGGACFQTAFTILFALSLLVRICCSLFLMHPASCKLCIVGWELLCLMGIVSGRYMPFQYCALGNLLGQDSILVSALYFIPLVAALSRHYFQ